MILALFAIGFVQTDLTFVRHAETVANASSRYNAQTLNAISRKGSAQIGALTAALLKMPKFDAIYVSPSPRAMSTIAPYLIATHQRAIIMPLLYECCTGKHTASKPTKYSWGGAITVPPELKDIFLVRPAMSRLPVAPDFGSGLAQVADNVRQIQSLCLGKRVLLVGHSGEGGQLIHALTNKWIKIDNAKPIALRL